MAASPTQRSLEVLRSDGTLVDVVERRVPYTNKTKDLYGFIDLLGITEAGETLAIQVTSGSNHAARRKKIAESETVARVRAAGWRILVHSWRKNAAGRWLLRVEDLS